MNESDNRASVPIADMEQDTGDAAFSTHGVKTLDTPVHIRVISYRAREHDPDGISAKAVIDGLVNAGILSNDTTKQVKEVTFESRKSKEEKTVIEIETI